MPTLTATLVNPTGPVRLDIDCTDIGAPFVYVTRVNNATGGATPVRTHGTTGSNGDGNAYQGIQAGFKGVMYDTEFPRDTTFHYAMQAPGWQLLANPTGEATAEPWSTSTGAVSYGSNITALPPGQSAVVLHPDGVSATVSATSEFVLATPTAYYDFIGTVTGPFPFTYRPVFSWYDSSQTLINNTTMPNTAVGAGVPSSFGYSVAAPANTRYVRVNLQVTGTPGVVFLTYWYNMALISEADNTAVSANLSVASPTGSAATWWLRDPLRPMNDVQITLAFDDNGCVAGSGVLFVGLTNRSYPTNSTRFNIAGQPQTQTVSRVRGALQGTLTLVTRTLADEAALLALLAPGSPLLFQSPPAYNLPDMYLSIDAEGVGLLSPDQTFPLRAFNLPFAAELAPGGPAQGVLNTRWADLCDWTWLSANTAGKTWLNVMDGGL